ncbi:hypothetical protein GGX14DRAFT_395546 [Mycena pura]|uniref:Tyr recombinase domain-containing protein n=1 Tax=Mycena pura TaxID=153505 RepID=A0AAD6VCD0_9AGAR|nr:hypothetical protein GGX14DRAFT_395546 [Mycena pura]
MPQQIQSLMTTPPLSSRINSTVGIGPRRSAQTTGQRPHPYKAGFTPKPSPLRPHVLARDRLRLWRPLSGRSSAGSGLPAGDADLERIFNVLTSAWAEGTTETYGSALLSWHIFCDSKTVPEPSRAPAAAYISALAGFLSDGTISNYISGIRAWHILQGVEWAMNTRVHLSWRLYCSISFNSQNIRKFSYVSRVTEGIFEYPKQSHKIGEKWHKKSKFRLVILRLSERFPAIFGGYTNFFWVSRAADRLTPASSKRQARMPYTVDILVKLRPFFNLSKPFDASLFMSSRQMFATSPIATGWSKQILPYREQSLLRTGRVFTGPNRMARPIRNLRSLNAPPVNGALFAYLHGSTHRSLTKTAFKKRLADAFKAADIDFIHVHGIRVGSTLEYLLRGVPLDVVKTKGRWASDAFAIYLRRHAEIMAPYMQAKPQLHANVLRIMMPRASAVSIRFNSRHTNVSEFLARIITHIH